MGLSVSAVASHASRRMRKEQGFPDVSTACVCMGLCPCPVTYACVCMCLCVFAHTCVAESTYGCICLLVGL